jgi:lysyl-tRNA synthetase class 2
LGEKPFQELCDLVDPGDIVEAVGTLFVTKRGEKSLEISSWRLLTKALLPLPEKWHGLQDVEQRFRKRYLDLLMNPEARLRLLSRTKMIASIRALMGEHGFIEVETPTLQPVYGGGFARPFKTHHNALDTDFYLRISDEMYLKRLIVGGLERVYEITKVFRNEGIDHDHSPEFTMFEAQIAYQDYRFGMDLFEEIFERASIATSGGTEITHGDVTINVKRPWKRLSLVDAVKEIGKVDVSKWKNVEDAKKFLATKLKEPRKVTELERMKTLGEVIAFAFEELVEEKLIQPTIIYDYPVEVSPLAKKKADDPAFTERFETFALGSEIGNNYSELNDPVDLEKRFVEEKKKEAAGFEEAHQTDEEYLEAIRHGMPPTCGLGIGIDRMAMLLTGAENIKEVVFFPTLRPKEKEEEEA